MQTLQAEILALKKNLTDANVKQIEEKEESITEKKNALEKHCRHLGITYGNYGAQENGHKLEDTNGEVSIVLTCPYISTDISSRQTGAMINGHVKDVHGSADVKMDDYSTIAPPTNSADAANSAALDGIQFPQLTSVNIPNSFDIHDETSMTTSYNAVAGVDNMDPFVTPTTHATTDFHVPTGTYGDPYGAPASDYTHGFINHDSFVNQNLDRTDANGKRVIDVDEYLMQTDGVMPADYTTSAGRVGDHGMGLGGDYEMDMDAMVPHAPVAEHAESVISGMDK